MLRSMFSGVSGLRSHQTMMDVIGNNISNVNTVGYKSSQVLFQDLLSQVLSNGGAPVAGAGGTNPAQIGLGVRVGAVSTSFGQGANQSTGRATDLSIQGDGFFVVRAGSENLYTRMGGFSFDTDGQLVSAEGGVVQGWLADATGGIDPNAPAGDLSVPLGQLTEPQQTQTIAYGGNLPADAATGAQLLSTIEINDAQGQAVPVTFMWTKTANPDEWTLNATTPDGAGGTINLYDDPGTGGTTEVRTVVFDPTTGQPLTVDGAAPTATSFALRADQLATAGQFNGQAVNVDMGTAGSPSSLVQFAGEGNAAALAQDGSTLGSLRSFTISPNGTITGVFSNGESRALGQIAMAAFNNPVGLERAGGSLYRTSPNSGLPQLGAAGTGGRGEMQSGSLEASNVDLAQEFTNLIVAQRGFQANSRVITASDELLGELVNLKR